MITLPDGRSFCPCGCPHCMMHPARVLRLTLDEALKLARKNGVAIRIPPGGSWLQKPKT
jgi:hypothetical protein